MLVPCACWPAVPTSRRMRSRLRCFQRWSATRRLGVVGRPGANVTYLIFQNEKPPFDRVEVRRAVARAIDREKIVKTLLGGRADVAQWMFPPGHWSTPKRKGAGGSVPPFEYAPALAHPRLRGLPPVTLVSSTDRARLTLARVMAQMLTEAGLRVRVVSLDLGVMFSRLDAGDFQMAVLQMPELTEPNVLKWFFHSTGVPGEGGRERTVRVTDRPRRMHCSIAAIRFET